MQDRPDVDHRLRPYMTAFHFLNRYRVVHFGGLGPIPIDAVIDYCRIHEIDGPEACRDMLDMVAAIDEEYLAWQREKDKDRGRGAKKHH